jgi:hypothetical protein
LTIVPELTFAQPVRRNLLAPVLIAFLLLGIVIALLIRLTPRKTADLAITRAVVLPTHTVFKSDTTLIGHDQVEDDLYVLTTLRIDDRLHLPLFLKDFTATLTTSDGQELTTSATEQRDLNAVYTSFPALKSLVTEPLLRETMIAPGQSAEGMILLHFPITKAVWDSRRTAVLNVDLYHQGKQTVLIEHTTEAASDPAQPPAPSGDGEDKN